MYSGWYQPIAEGKSNFVTNISKYQNQSQTLLAEVGHGTERFDLTNHK